MTMIFIKSGECHVRRAGGRIRTDLGSCVALCLWDARARVGGMNHYLLPGDGLNPPEDLTNGRLANQTLLFEMLKNGATLQTLQGAVVGGGQLFPENDIFAIGANNAAVAEFILGQYRVPMVFQRVGGQLSRSVEMDVLSGLLTVREIRLGTSHVQHIHHQFKESACGWDVNR